MDNDYQLGTRLQSTGWIIDARWFYASFAFFFGMIAKENFSFIDPSLILALSLVVALSCNAYFYFSLKKFHGKMIAERSLNLLNIAQISVDLSFFFIIMLLTGGGVTSIAHSFFFIPIIISMTLFGFRGTLFVALASGILVLSSVFIHEGIFATLSTSGATIALIRSLSGESIQALILSIFYLLSGFLGGYISRLIDTRDLLLLEQIKKEESHVKRLEEISMEFDKSAKLLVRRDLQLTVANEKLTQLDKMKSEIISVVAHQLRTPLAATKWTLKILLDEDAGTVTSAQKELLLKGFESNERMIILVNDILAVDRLESGKLKYNFVPVQFEELVQEMIGSVLPLATQKNIRVEFITPQQPLQKIKIDPDKMRDVLQNLIDNAIKYTKNGGTITVGVEMQKLELHFWVKDNGIGIPEEEKDKIFSRFFRADNAIHTQTDGSGLGLFIAASVVKRHGGTVWFDSVLNRGTTFHVLLPFTI